MARLIGLTGGIGSGKSTVADGLARRGAVVVDADRIARDVVEPGGAAYGPLVERFGSEILAADGQVDRKALAAIAFADERARRDLNAITHPVIGYEMLRQVGAHAGGDGVVVLDIPLLTPGTRDRWGFAGIIVVDAPVEVAVRRLVTSRGFDEADARARVASQISREERRALVEPAGEGSPAEGPAGASPGKGSPAGFLIDNSGDWERLEAQVEAAWRWVLSLPAPG